jgi:hypothetical protein
LSIWHSTALKPARMVGKKEMKKGEGEEEGLEDERVRGR